MIAVLAHRARASHFNDHGQEKRGWLMQVEAERWARLLFTVGQTELLLDSYQCGICRQWHLGHGDGRAEDDS